MRQITARQLADWLADSSRDRPALVDVREPWEFELCHIDGSEPVPMQQVPNRLEDIPRDREVVVICHHGGRSMQVAMFLERSGFSAVNNLMGGVDAWAQEIDPAMRRY